MVSFRVFFGGSDLWMSLTVASLVSFRIDYWAWTSVLSYSSWLAPQAFWSTLFIPPRSSSFPVQSSSSALLAIRWNSCQFSITDCLPCFIFLSLILPSPLASITPY